MKSQITPIIETAELLKLYQNENVIIVDASSGKNAKENYFIKHLDNALYIDLNSQLAVLPNDFADGGRHPLPSINKFAETLQQLGITNDSHVIVYDDKSGANAAARFWWMLKSIGHEKVQVLNGGIQEAEKVNFPINNNIEIPKTVEPYKFEDWKLHTAEINEVEKHSLNKNYIVIDVRENNRYRGEIEPIDLVAGHIPGAINVPFSTNLNENGQFLSPMELKEKYQTIFGNIKSENIIIHCGSGVTACHSLLAIDYAGLAIPKLYAGSWSEWSRNNKKIATDI